MPIIHLHGKLGAFLTNKSDALYRGFETKVSPAIIEHCIPQVKIIHEVNVSDNPQFIKAKEMLHYAERICFLGFGYDKTNMHRLFGDVGPIFFSKKEIYGTTWGLTQAEVKRMIREQLTLDFHGGNSSFNNLDLLRETGILL